MLRAVRRLALVIITILSASCAEPPTKEISQAQAAIDAARAAGAERFATAELTAASDALKRSEEAVTSGDYRQALSHAIDSRERAQAAAKMAVDGRADARGHAEREIAEVTTLLTRTEAQIRAGEKARLSPRILREPQATAAAAEKTLQEARTRLKADDYDGVTKALDGSAGQLQASLSMIDAALSPKPAPRKR